MDEAKTVFIAHLYSKPDFQCGALPACARWESGSIQRAWDLLVILIFLFFLQLFFDTAI